MAVSQKDFFFFFFFGGPCNEDYTLGSILPSPYLGKLTCYIYLVVENQTEKNVDDYMETGFV